MEYECSSNLLLIWNFMWMSMVRHKDFKKSSFDNGIGRNFSNSILKVAYADSTNI